MVCFRATTFEILQGFTVNLGVPQLFKYECSEKTLLAPPLHVVPVVTTTARSKAVAGKDAQSICMD